MRFNCPICGKGGLPDYKKQYVVCPQCKSDLKPFVILASISNKSKPKAIRYLIAVSLLIIIVLSGTLIRTSRNTSELTHKTNALADSLEKVNSKMAAQQLMNAFPLVIKKDKTTINYVVKKGDYPYKIAEFFFGDGSMYKKIEADNDLVQPYTLKVGQVLKIKLPDS